MCLGNMFAMSISSINGRSSAIDSQKKCIPSQFKSTKLHHIAKLILFCTINLSLIKYSHSLSTGDYYCETPKDCGDFMICLDNECICDEDDDDPSNSLTSTDYNENKYVGLPCKGVSLVGNVCNNKTVLCIGSSVCNSITGICECPHGFEEVKVSHECKRSYGFPCDDKSELCNPEKFLVCSDPSDTNDHTTRTCICHNGSSIQYDPVKQSCFAQAGGECELHSWMGVQLQCEQNAFCAPGAEATDSFYGVCRCHDGFYLNEEIANYKCVPVYNRKCDLTSDCETGAKGSDLECVKSQCRCKTGLVYEMLGNLTQPGECRLMAGTECGSNAKNCVTNALCLQDSDTEDKFTCQCDEDYLSNSEGHCQLTFGTENCSISDIFPSENCNEEAGLKCLENKCSCESNHVFDPDISKCLGLKGAPCGGVKYSQKCAPNSECHPEQLTCDCLDSFVLNETSGHCLYGFGTFCNPENDNCPSELGLECRTLNKSITNNQSQSDLSICSCSEEGTIFDKIKSHCLLKVGEHCSYPQRRCIKQAFCGTGDKCQCYSGFTPTPDGACLLAYGQNCSTFSEFSESLFSECNFHSGLLCISDLCQCIDGHEYTDTLNICIESEGVNGNSKQNRRETTQIEINSDTDNNISSPSDKNSASVMTRGLFSEFNVFQVGLLIIVLNGIANCIVVALSFLYEQD